MKKCPYCDEAINESDIQCPNCGGDCEEQTIELDIPDDSEPIRSDVNQYTKDNKHDENKAMFVKIFRIIVWALMALSLLNWLCSMFQFWRMISIV